MFKRGGSEAKGQVGLPEARKALAERYTIDAEEAEARAHRAIDEQARREEVEAEAQRATEERARRREAELRARRLAEEQARRQEAEARAMRAAEENARRVEAEARRAAEERARRRAAEDEARRAAEELARREERALTLVPEPASQPPEAEVRQPANPHPEPDETTEDLPLFGWMQSVVPESPEADDWTRTLLEGKKPRSDESRLA